MIAVAAEHLCGKSPMKPAGEDPYLLALEQEIRTLRCERNYYQTLHERAKAREEQLKQDNQQLKARIRYLEQKLYGRKSEKKTASEKTTAVCSSVIHGSPWITVRPRDVCVSPPWGEKTTMVPVRYGVVILPRACLVSFKH